MHFSQILVMTVAALVTANPVPEPGTSSAQALAANCNDSIGNCYANGCEGNPTTLVCTRVRRISESQLEFARH